MTLGSLELIGTPSNNVAVNVSAPVLRNDAAFIGQSVSTSMTVAGQYPVSVTFTNTGTTTWDPANGKYVLLAVNPVNNETWKYSRIPLGSAVPPGQQRTIAWTTTAPSSPGTYNFQWILLQEGVELFGATSQNVAVSVTEAVSQDTVTYIHTDALGSPVARSDSTGNVISRTSYEPYGRTASGVRPTIGFTGHVNDADTGLVYMQQRYYDPVAGRFLSVDPIFTDTNSGASFNRYVYANNSPFAYRDPDGRAIESIWLDKNKNLSIVIGMKYTGATTPEIEASLNAAIVHKWSGKFGACAVNITVVPGSQAKFYNVVNIVDGVGKSSATNSARTVTLYTHEADGSSMEKAMQHEVGHLFGMSKSPFDKYYESGKPLDGWKGNIMAEGATVEERNITDLLGFGRAYLGKRERIYREDSPGNTGPQGCVAAGDDCWN